MQSRVLSGGVQRTIGGVITAVVFVAVGCGSTNRSYDEPTGAAGAASGGSMAGSGGDAGQAGTQASGGASGGTEPGAGGAGGGGEAGTSSGGANGGGSSGAPPSDCPLGCLPPAPEGWTGPSAVYDGPESERPATCPDEYSLEEVEAHQGMTADPATCTCPPGETSGEQCIATVTRYVDAACSPGAANATEYPIPGSSSCVSVANTVRLRVSPSAIDLSNASCDFGDPTTELAAPTFERVHLACGLPVAAACDGRPDCTAAPLPQAPFGRLCIHKEGDHSCPDAGGYGARFLAYREIEDTRACGACSGAPSGGTCGEPGANVAFYQDSGCMNPSAAGPRDACFDTSSSQSYLDLTQFAPTGVSCDSGSAPSFGEAQSIAPITFCCVR